MLMSEIRDADYRACGVERIKLRHEYLVKRKSGPIAICPSCGEAYPSIAGPICLACKGGQLPYPADPDGVLTWRRGAGTSPMPVDASAFTGLVISNPDQGCEFCTYAGNGAKIIENEYAFCKLDSYPFTYGHTLVIPKRHFPDYFDAKKVEQDAMQDLLHARRQQLLETDPSIEGFNVAINSGAVAGQTVFHCHVHLIPRRKSGQNSGRHAGMRSIIGCKKTVPS